MNDALENHCVSTFKEHPTVDKLTKDWLEKIYPKNKGKKHYDNWKNKLAEKEDARWRVLPKDIMNARRLTRNSTPGLDGIPYMAYRQIHELSSKILASVLDNATQEDASQEFDEAFRQIGND